MTMRESKDLSKLELHDLFPDLKAYEFELEVRSGEEASSSQSTKSLIAANLVTNSFSNVAVETTAKQTAEQISNEAMSLFLKKFSRFMNKKQRVFQNQNRSFKKEPST